MKLAIKTNKTADITDLIPKFVVFFDASIPITITRDANNKISGWLDRSLNGFHATQLISGNQPNYTSFDGFFGIGFSNVNSVNNGFLQFTVPADFSVSNGILYVATDKYLLPLPINIATSASARTFEITGGIANILTGLILFNGTPTPDEDSRITSYLRLKGANRLPLASLNMDFCVQPSSVSGLYGDPLLRQVSSLNALGILDMNSLNNVTKAFLALNKITEFPVIDSRNITSINQTWFGMSGLQSFPALNLSNVTNARSAFLGCTGISSFFNSFSNLSKAIDVAFAWNGCTNLVNFPAMNFAAANTFESTWTNCKLNTESIDNILISIAAGLANNPNKVLATNGGNSTLTGGTNSAPGTFNRRVNWGANAWEFNLSQVNENISATTYNFTNGITGLQAKAWLAAKGWAIATN